MILHVLNGDCALNGWKQCNFSGEVVVWRENYLHGVIPATEDISLFNRLRAGELHKITPERSVDEIFDELQLMHQKLFSLRQSDLLVLWLDHCPFDRALKSQLLKLISAMTEKPELYIVQQDVVWDGAAFKHFSNWKAFPAPHQS